MYDMIREWPRYVKLPFPIAKVTDKIVYHFDFRQSVSEAILNYRT